MQLQCGVSRAGGAVRPFTATKKAPHTRVALSVQCQATHQLRQQQQQSSGVVDRRDALLQLGSFTAAAAAVSELVSLSAGVPSAAAGPPPQVPEVGTYLPPAGVDDLVLFVPDSKKTPALRAGTVNPSSPYKFALPPSFRQAVGRTRGETAVA